MARYFVEGKSQHLIQRGNNREPIFVVDDDYRFYLECLQEAAERHSRNLALNDIRFLFREVLQRPRNEIYLAGPRQPQRLPEILEREEVGRILSAATDLRHKTLLMTIYAAGLRVSELCHLWVKDSCRGTR